MTSVSVILPAFNVAEYLRPCLVALSRQAPAGGDVEVIVVDNNSTDDTVAIAREFPWVRILHESKQGSYAARNCGVRASSGEVVVFLDPDCAPRDGWLDAAVQGLADPATSIVLGRRYYGTSRELTLLSMYEDEKIQWILRRGGTDQVYGYTNNMAVRRSVLLAHGPFPERMRGGDTIFVQRVIRAQGVGAVCFKPEMAVDHLEVTSLGAYYRKRAIYGESNERLSSEVPFRPLTGGQRFSVFGALVREGRVAPWNALVLLALLVPGAMVYERARRRAK